MPDAAQSSEATRLLVWYWGRRGGGARYSEEVLKGLLRVDRDNVLGSFSRQAHIAQAVRRACPKAQFIDTYQSAMGLAFRVLGLPALYARFFSYISQNNISCVLTTMSHVFTPLFTPFLRMSRIPHALTVHDAAPHPGDRRGPGLLAKSARKDIQRADALVVLTRHVGNELQRLYDADPDKIILSRHGALHYPGLEPMARDYGQGPLDLVFYGRIMEYKGLGVLARAVEILQQDMPDIRLRIFGQGDLRPHADVLGRINNLLVVNRWIDEQEVAKCFQGPCINMALYLEASQSGTVPLACAAGVPTVCSSAGGLPEQVENERTGLVVPGDTEKELTDGLVQALRRLHKDRDLLTAMSANCLDYAEERLDWDAICKDLYLELKKKF